MNRLMAAAAAACIASAAFSACAQYPDRPVTIVVPFSAGVPTDQVAHDLADALRKPLGTSIVIENVGGAGGTLGAAKAAKSTPNGYTLLLTNIGIATAAALYRHLQYRALDDFEYLGMVDEMPMTLIARPGMPADNYPALVKWLRANKGKANLANTGIGSASHLCGLMFQSAAKVDMQTVPYKSAEPAMTELIGGQVDLMCDQVGNTRAQIEAGKVKAYAVTSAQRLATPALAGLPTLDELGLKGFNVTIWHGLYAPKGTPKPIVDKINAALRQALDDPEFIRREQAQGAVVITDRRVNGAEHKKFVEAEIGKWGAVIRGAGQYAE